MTLSLGFALNAFSQRRCKMLASSTDTLGFTSRDGHKKVPILVRCEFIFKPLINIAAFHMGKVKVLEKLRLSVDG